MPPLSAAPNTLSVDLRSLIGHAHSVPATATVEMAQATFARLNVDFLAALDGETLVGVCARRELTQSLSSRFGFALNAKHPVSVHLRTASLRIVVGADMTDVFKATAARNDREFYDDVLLVDKSGRYVGMIAMSVLARLQTEFLLGNIVRLETSRREIAEKNHQMEEDLQMAREVQLAMLPSAQERVTSGAASLHLAHRYQPAGGMSGDFFATLRLTDDAVGILICDVMGHGVRSALVTAMVRALLEQLRPVAADPGALLTCLNRDLTHILRQAGGLIFVTAAYVVVDLPARQLRYAQAGHPTPLRRDRAGSRMLPIGCSGDVAGPALGLIEDFEFASCTEEIAHGGRLVLFTDGLTEAASPAGEEFGETRLAAALSRNDGRRLDQCLENVLEEVIAFTSARFTDDVCIVAAEIAAAD